MANNEARIDRNQACYMPAMTINRWLAVRLEFLGSCLMFSTALVSVAALLISNSVDAGLVGLMMTYTISVTGTLVGSPCLIHVHWTKKREGRREDGGRRRWRADSRP